jgi:acyl-CoA reductase-like NAD-dependent aldehyde dehydrogenase
MSTVATFDSHNPATGEVFATYRNTSAEEVAEAVAKAQLAGQLWGSSSFAARKSLLLQWAKLLTKNIDEMAALICSETGKPKSDAILEITLAIEHVAWAAKHAEQVLRNQRRPSGLLMINMKSRVERSPYGVVGVIGPWNYPIFTPMGSIVYALAAGNAVVFKPSEYTPGIGQWLADSFAEISFIPNLFICVPGLADTGRALTESQVGKIAFTGSTATAKKVASAAAQRMTPTVLECGGKDAVLVAEDANISRAAEFALWSAMSNAGQTCIGAERVYVVESVADQFLKEISEMARNIHAASDGNYGPATMPSQIGVIRSHVEDAQAHGAKFLVGGPESVGDRFVQPIIMTDVAEDSTAMSEETFGPTLAINRVANINEAIAKANASRYGLGASVWSRRKGNQIASQLQCGMVSVNSVIAFAAVASVPFGGVKDSGNGRIHGPEGLMEFTYPRTVVSESFRIPIAFTTFKRTAFVDKFIRKAIEILH